MADYPRFHTLLDSPDAHAAASGAPAGQLWCAHRGVARDAIVWVGCYVILSHSAYTSVTGRATSEFRESQDGDLKFQRGGAESGL